MNGLTDRLLEAQRELQERPVAQILASLDRVAARWLDRGDPLRRATEAQLAKGTGLAPAMIARGLDLTTQRVRGLGELLGQDLRDVAALDGFVRLTPGPGPGLFSRAFGPGLLVCIFSGNVPGLPAFDMALALALKSACLARPAAAEPAFAELWARSVAEEDELLGRCLAVRRWEYGDTWPYQRAGAVLAYGSDQSLAAIRRAVPEGARFIGHGHRVSLAAIAREEATAETAGRLALDVAMYDQQGCMSPHVAYVERGGPLTPLEFARACSEALEALQQEMPRGRLTRDEAMALRAARDEAEFAADACFASRTGLEWAVVHSEAADFVPSPLNRLLRTYALDDLIAEVAAAAAKARPYLQTVAFAGPVGRREELATALGRLGATRIGPVGRMQEPGPLLHHDGWPTAGALVRWLDIEEENTP